LLILRPEQLETAVEAGELIEVTGHD
jgi:hypothetical protein